MREMSDPPAYRNGPGVQRAADDPQAFVREFWDPRVQSKRWLEAMSSAIDVWLRSTTFLELMAAWARGGVHRPGHDTPELPGEGSNKR
jgi:hypothetical protein